MKIDRIFKQIQDIITNPTPPVIVLGSGASVSYGIASMWELAKMLKTFFTSNVYPSQESNECVKRFLDFLNSGNGLEEALLKAKVTEEVEVDIVYNVWNMIVHQDAEVYKKAISGENIDLKELFDFLIYGRKGTEINVVSTNYDKIAEYAAAQSAAYINTGYASSYLGVLKQNLDSCPTQLKNSYIGKINIWKVHGSLDWFKKDNQSYYFPNLMELPSGYQPCIITPGNNKYEKTQQPPHRQLLTKVDECFTKASGFLCIGYGFNDEHVQPVLLDKASKNNLPILIITKDIGTPIRSKVMDGKHNYIAIYSDGVNGCKIETKEGVIPIPDKEYWKLKEFCTIIK